MSGGRKRGLPVLALAGLLVFVVGVVGTHVAGIESLRMLAVFGLVLQVVGWLSYWRGGRR